MTDYRYLPPQEGEEPPDPHTCQGCGNDCNFTTKIVIESLCSDCIRNTNLPDGTVASRNKMRAPEPDMSGPEGFFSLVRNTSDFGINANLAGSDFNNIYGKPPSPKIPAPKYVPDARYYNDVPTRPPGSGYRYEYPADMDYSRPPTLQDSSNYVYEYIRRNYSPGEIQEHYSEIRDELLYPKQTIQMQIIGDDRIPPGTAVFRSGASEAVTVNLTELSDSDTLDVSAGIPETEETELKHILSREEADAAYKQASAALAEIDRLEKKYSPDLTDGSVIAFRLTLPGVAHHFSYAAIRAAGLWFVSGKVSQNHPVGVGLDWSILLSCFESYQATEFIVLREGGDQVELEAGPVPPENLNTRTAVVDPERTDAFQGEPKAGIIESRYLDDEEATEDDLAGTQSGKYHE